MAAAAAHRSVASMTTTAHRRTATNGIGASPRQADRVRVVRPPRAQRMQAPTRPTA